MNSYLSTQTFAFLSENNIKVSSSMAARSKVGLPWLRRWFYRKGRGGYNVVFVERIHRDCVVNNGMPSIFNEKYDISSEK